MNINFELCDAIREGNIQRLVEMVEEHGIGPALSSSPGQPDSPLHYAAEIDNFEAVEHLLDNGADINWGQPNYLTPLEVLLIENDINWEMVEFLVNRGAILVDREIQKIELSDETFQKFTEIFDLATFAAARRS